ncbi:AI-2E family transporter [Frigoribacterium sp. VKM Ac-1396]|uniref:AI-2E family transporter n=1 Tax=Frigoribacterium sp. VKM Ac-1396 TaxID=2783821 RepID=UPI001E373E34|nr:AI-2E family transporter [Frigoribacterium sp. VKM Ac-1396]
MKFSRRSQRTQGAATDGSATDDATRTPDHTAPTAAAPTAPAPATTGAVPADPARASLPPGMIVAGAWAWRLLAVAAALAVLFWLIATLEEIVVPLLIAILVSAFLVPVAGFLHRHRWPRWLAIVAALLAGVVVVGGLVLLAVTQIRAGLPQIEKQSVAQYDQLTTLLQGPPFQLTNADVDGYLKDAQNALQTESKAILSGVLSIGTAAGHLLAGGLLTLFATIFLMIDGRGVWAWTVRLFPKAARPAVDGAGQAGWHTLTSFVRVQIVVAAVNAVGIGLIAFFLGLPLAVPIAILVFLASFIPVVGAIVTGALAVVVALVFAGPLQAVIMLAGVLVVHLLEAHVLQPLVMGSAVRVHPLAVVFAVAGGSYVAGIPGALFAVPTVAVLNVMVKYVATGAWRRTRVADDVAAGASGTA